MCVPTWTTADVVIATSLWVDQMALPTQADRRLGEECFGEYGGELKARKQEGWDSISLEMARNSHQQIQTVLKEIEHL